MQDQQAPQRIRSENTHLVGYFVFPIEPCPRDCFYSF